jgi:hypothetical protein
MFILRLCSRFWFSSLCLVFLELICTVLEEKLESYIDRGYSKLSLRFSPIDNKILHSWKVGK